MDITIYISLIELTYVSIYIYDVAYMYLNIYRKAFFRLRIDF